MNDNSDPTARNSTSPETPGPPHESDEWRVWRPFLISLGGLIFAPVVVSVSL